MPRKDPEARRAYRAARKLTHHAEILAQQARSRAKHRQSIRERDAKRREANRETIRARDREAYAANPEPKKVRSRTRWAEKKDILNPIRNAKNAENPFPSRARSAQWQTANRRRKTARDKVNRALNPTPHRVRNGRRRAKKLLLPDTWTPEQCQFMHAYWQHSCAVCGNQSGFFWRLANDHWIPLTSDNCPGTVADNMIPLCHGQGGCNNSKHDTEPHAWLLARYGKQKTAKIEKAIAAYFTEVHRRFPSEPLTS